MGVRALLAMTLMLPLFAIGGGAVVAHEGDAVVDEIYDIKHAAMAEIDAVVMEFKTAIFEAPDQATRDALLVQALEDVEDSCKEGAEAITEIGVDHPEQAWAVTSAIAYLEDYTHNAEETLIRKHGKASEQGSTTTTSTTTTTSLPSTQPPSIEITSPDDGAVFDESTVLFVGVATPGAVVNVGPFNAATDAEGNWSITLVLDEGRNVARVVATNQAGQAMDQVVVFFEVPATTTTSTTTTTTTLASTTTTTLPATSTPTSTTTTTIVPAATSTDSNGPSTGQGSFQAAFAPLLDGRTTPAGEDGRTEFGEAVSAMSGAAVVSASNGAFALIRPVVPYVLEEPVFSIIAVMEMIGRALTASGRNLLGPAIVTLGYLVVSMARRRRSIIA